MKTKPIVKIAVFVIILSFVFGGVGKLIITLHESYNSQKVTTNKTPSKLNKKVILKAEDPRNFQRVAGFYEEPKESLDAVYIGSSNCYVFWNSMFAWEEYGIAVWPYATNGMMFESVEYIIKEGRKTQPNALYIVNVNSLSNDNKNLKRIHYTADYMPFSLNKNAMMSKLGEMCGVNFSENMGFYLPQLDNKYKEKFVEKKIKYKVDGMKGVTKSGAYLNKSVDVTGDYVTSDEKAVLPKETQEALNSLLDYCDKEDVNVLFVTVPRAEDKTTVVPVFNAVNEIVESRGYPTLFLIESLDDMNLDMTIDYYHKRHTNIHGSIKFTQYMSKYLIENYGFENKKEDKLYSSWNEGWDKYTKVIEPWVLDIELDYEHRDFSIERPESLKAEYYGGAVSLFWSASEGAEKYAVYRKQGEDGAWNLIGEYSGLSCVDEEPLENQEVTYRVVPCYEKDGHTYYGSFSYKGVKVSG